MISLLDRYNLKQKFGQVLGLMAPMEVDESAPALFAQCRFALVCGEGFSAAAAQKVRRHLSG
jgi:hypothetical protein